MTDHFKAAAFTLGLGVAGPLIAFYPLSLVFLGIACAVAVVYWTFLDMVRHW